jgi:hypothetical protein
LGYGRFLAGMALLTTNYPPRGGSAEAGEALLAAWWGVLSGKEWITDAIFEAAVRLTLEHVTDFLPSVGEFARICGIASDDLARETRREAQAALRPPAYADPHAATPEERERWAREDAWIRQWYPRAVASRVTGDTLERMPAAERDAILDSYRNDDLVSLWPTLTPEARRAKERRIEARLAPLLPAEGSAPKEHSSGRKLRVVWKDGVISEVPVG